MSKNRLNLNNSISAVILAAGFGMRIEGNVPKALIKVRNGKTILDYQVKFLSKFISIENFIVVVGHKKELIMEQHPELAYVYNESYNRTNTGKSLLKALRKLGGQDVLWINGDVIFDQALVAKLINKSKNLKKSCILVDDKKCGEEEIKYNVDTKGSICLISKEVKNAKGEALGINILVKENLPKFIRYLEKSEPNDYFEKAIENMILNDKVIFKPVSTKGLFCQEIDFIGDLKIVKDYLRTSKI